MGSFAPANPAAFLGEAYTLCQDCEFSLAEHHKVVDRHGTTMWRCPVGPITKLKKARAIKTRRKGRWLT